ncbi:LCP family glycopolymer transferase [Listeria ilorinensis]|uniref:LCP family glycopolymer transferase n=1 Tax=Listeria ilorinensis TaxID=2867439 RepID=UPI001EF627FD|nr:LCP family protein [Listeria ilorinensis]
METTRSTKHRKRKKHPLKTFFKILGVVLLGIGFAFGGLVIKYYLSLESTMDKINTPLKSDASVKADKEKLNDKKPFSILLIGTDAREDEENGRSDTLILVTVNKQKNTVEMLSIPRDTEVTYSDGDIGKINASYSTDGAQGSVDAVESLMDGIPIDYFVSINMNGFKDLVDAVGGITVTNEVDLTEVNPKFKKGEIELNGTEALQYVRIRHEDPRGDFGRQDRQKDVIVGICDKVAKSTAGITNFSKIMDAVGDNVQTNLSLDDITVIAKNYASVLDGTINDLELEGEDQMVYSEAYGFDLYYFVPYQESIDKNVQIMQEQLGISSNSSTDTKSDPDSSTSTE